MDAASLSWFDSLRIDSIAFQRQSIVRYGEKCFNTIEPKSR